jgi:copper chaperone NosL
MKKASLFMILGALLLMGLFKFPLWNIMLGAPQYPEPLGMNIYIDGIKGMNEFDIQNIDGLNHYIGMKTLPKPEDMWEFSVFPMVIGTMSALGVIIGLLGFFGKVSHNWFLAWIVIMTVLGILGMYDFNAWMSDYGTNLDEHAIMKLQNPDGTPMSYKPPLLGHQKMLNFDAYSFPRLGGYLMGLGILFTIFAYSLGKRAIRSKV